jgi:hypothetical protein
VQLNYELAPAANNTSQIARTDNHEVMTKIDILAYQWSVIPLVYFSYFASFFGTLSNTMLRGLVIIVNDDYLSHNSGDSKFGVGPMIILIIINIVLMLTSLIYLNKCLQYYDTIYIIPMVKIFTLMNTIICGGVVYKEFDQYDEGNVIGIFIGTFLGFVGASFYLFKREKLQNKKLPNEDGVISRASYGTCTREETTRDTGDVEEPRKSCHTI